LFQDGYAKLQARYYDDKEITWEKYQADLQRLWETYDTASVLEGHRQPRGFHVMTYWARVAAFAPTSKKPITVRRSFAGAQIQMECYATQTVAALFQQGKLKVGDIVIVSFVDEELDKAVVIDKVWGV